jgi:hypothetical protein
MKALLFKENINYPLDNLKILFGIPNKLFSQSSASLSAINEKRVLLSQLATELLRDAIPGAGDGELTQHELMAEK